MARKLEPAEIESQLKNFPDWLLDQQRNQLYTAIEFQDFDRAIDFIDTVRDIANSINHHPDIYLFDFKFVQLFIGTHEATGITDTDFQFAQLIDQLFSQSTQVQAQVEQEAINTLQQTLLPSSLPATPPAATAPIPQPAETPAAEPTAQTPEPAVPETAVTPSPDALSIAPLTANQLATPANASPGARPILPPPVPTGN
jgi:4a-hydroxytetrahydrobiopterin dehydratase